MKLLLTNHALPVVEHISKHLIRSDCVLQTAQQIILHLHAVLSYLQPNMYRIGCDVGGTNTDAAILDASRLQDESKGVLATFKTPTTADVTDGIKEAIEEVLKRSQIDRQQVLNVAVGTTHFVNAVVENDARRLDRVAVIRLCGPYTRSVCRYRSRYWYLS